MALDALFSPRAVAVVGASNRELTIGYRIIENLLEFGYTGSIYPVNPKGGEIRGLKAYPSIVDVPKPVDVAHIVIKNAYVPGCLEDCAKQGVKAAIVNTAGFRETGDEGAALEDRLVAIGRKTGIRGFGPNCQGIINTDPAVRAYRQRMHPLHGDGKLAGLFVVDQCRVDFLEFRQIVLRPCRLQIRFAAATATPDDQHHRDHGRR